MPLDAVCLMALHRELDAALVGARVDKIYMPGRDEVQLIMRTKREKNLRLLLNCNPGHPRAHLTKQATDNPAAPPMFCMLLRKHLIGARLAAVEQPPMERVLYFHFDITDELGEPCRKTFVAEMIGRHSNLILQGADRRIIDCLKRVDSGMSETRQVLPGLFYRAPPTQGKLDPLGTNEESWKDMILAMPPGTARDDWLLKHFTGMSPLVCRELAARAPEGVAAGAPDGTTAGTPYGSPEAFWEQVLHWRRLASSGGTAPWMLYDGDQPVDFSYLPITQYGDRYRLVLAESFSHMLDAFFSERARIDRRRAQSRDIAKLLTTLRDRAARKMALQEGELAQTEGRGRLREYGDMLMAYQRDVPVGASSVTVFDFYHDEPCEIRLHKTLSAIQNAARYYKDYQKAKNAQIYLTEQIARGREELAYLDSVVEELSRAESAGDIQDIRQELAQGGYLREAKGKKAIKAVPSAPMRFVSSTGVVFWAGRNNRQNEILTLKTAARGDIWLHAKNTPGSHVVVPVAPGGKGGTGGPGGSGNLGGGPGGPNTPGRDDSPGGLDDTTLREAAQVAATLSRAAGGGRVAVDYTRAAYVKKPPGAKSGMVVYDKYKTIIVAPDRDLVDRLQQTKLHAPKSATK